MLHAGLSHFSSTYAGPSLVTKTFFLMCLMFAIAGVVLWSTDFMGSEQPADLSDVIEGCTGTWAQTYRKAGSQQRLALDLLYWCKIITPEEFAHGHVGQGHIDECVWIATVMLRQRSLEEWLQNKDEARQAFEKSVTACFQARTDVLDMQKFETPLSPRSSGASHGGSHVSAGVQGKTPSSGGKPAVDQKVLSRDSKGQSLLVKRCREIMASTSRPAARAWSSAPAAVARDGNVDEEQAQQTVDAGTGSSGARVAKLGATKS